MGKRVPVKEHKCSDLDVDFEQRDEEWEKMKTKTTRKAKRRRSVYSLENGDAQPESQEGSLKQDSTEYESSTSNTKNSDGGIDTKAARDHLDSSVSTDTSSFLENNQDVMEIMLVDVQLSVNASPGAENAPFVSLTSEAYGIAIIGHALDVGEIREESTACKLRLDQLVWRTSKRSPVCYLTSSPCASRKGGKSVKDAMLPAGNRKEKSLMKLLKNSKQGEEGSNKTCVPVQLIFSKLLAAV